MKLVIVGGVAGNAQHMRVSVWLHDGLTNKLTSAAKREITALAVDDQGNIYAAGVGEKRGVTPQFGGFGNPSVVATPTFGGSAGGQGGGTMGGSASPMLTGPFPFPALGATGGINDPSVAAVPALLRAANFRRRCTRLAILRSGHPSTKGRLLFVASFLFRFARRDRPIP